MVPKLKIYALAPKPSFGPISTNHLGSSNLHSENDLEAVLAAKTA